MNDAHKSRPRVMLFFGASGRSQPAAGPVQSLSAMIAGLRGEADFTFVVSPVLAEKLPKTLTDIADVVALDTSRQKFSGIRDLVNSVKPDLVILNSFFDREYTFPYLLWQKFGRGHSPKTLVSPRGELAAGALSIKSRGKRAYIALVKALGLTRTAWLHATADHELDDIKTAGLPNAGLVKVPNMRLLTALPDFKARAKTAPIRLAFVGRISAVKNLHIALDCLKSVKAPCEYRIYGPISEHPYWAQCEAIIRDFPDHVTARHMGTLPQTEVATALAEADLLFLPTKGENFGHAIFEALSAGCPVLISDQTPWRQLQDKNAGWDLALGSTAEFTKTIDLFANLPDETHMQMRSDARALAEQSAADDGAAEANRRMIQTLLTNTASKADE